MSIRIAKLLRSLARLALIGILVMLTGALAWTALQLAAIPQADDQIHATIQARQASYSRTATAIAGEASASSRRAPRFHLMQNRADDDGPAATVPAAAAVNSATIEPPDDVPLPKLLIPLDPGESQQLNGTAVPTRVAPVIRRHQLVNIMMLGSDEELSEDNFARTDTMIIVSLNLDTGSAAMLSLPRDLLVYIPSGTMGRLNMAYGIGEKLGWQPGGGFGLLRQTLFYNFGINVHFHARVNFSGFEAIIDRLGGIDIAVDCAYRDWYPQADGAYDWRLLPAGYYSFDGFDALWYARTRKNTDDIDRGRRQQQLLRAMWRKARQNGLLASLPSLWTELTQVAYTDMPLELALRLLPLAIELEPASVENLTFKRNYHSSQWVTPGGAEVLLPNPERTAALMQDFYLPPSANQIALAGPSIAIYNAAGKEHWDIVAAQRLRWDGYNAVALGSWSAGNLASSQLTDFVATEKGSLTGRILKALNMTEKQTVRLPSADRQFDYQVILGQDYQSCTYAVLPIDD